MYPIPKQNRRCAFSPHAAGCDMLNGVTEDFFEWANLLDGSATSELPAQRPYFQVTNATDQKKEKKNAAPGKIFQHESILRWKRVFLSRKLWKEFVLGGKMKGVSRTSVAVVSRKYAGLARRMGKHTDNCRKKMPILTRIL